MQQLSSCNICHGEIQIRYKLCYKDIVDLANEWIQEIAICPKCGFIFTANPFDEEQLGNRYKDFSKFEYNDKSYDSSKEEGYKKQSIRQQQFISRNIDLSSINSILEVGAASGCNLSLYTNLGWDVMGIEPSPHNCKDAKMYYGLDMFCGTFSEFWSTKENKKYDLIFLSHVLEHIVNPKDFIEQCALLNNSYMYIEVPTFDYKFIDEPFGMFCEEHVDMFTLESLQELMVPCGYELINADMLFAIKSTLPAGSPAIATIWQKRKLPRKKKIVNNVTNVLDTYISQSEEDLKRIQSIINSIDENKKLAIWGTGHHASMLLANSNLQSKNIVRVYDSFSKKHGLKFAGCSIQPFNAEDIEDGMVEVILVATYTAQKAIVKILEQYKDKAEIITLYSS